MFNKKISIENMKKETYLKAEILVRGVSFTLKALEYARNIGAKGQNLTYNIPLNAEVSRPQELFIKGKDGYTVVVSCVSPNNTNHVLIDYREDKLIAFVDNKAVKGVEIDFVKEPSYYNKILDDGSIVKKYISACGYDELNILPWKGCAISSRCKFCGVNLVASKNDINNLTAHNISKDIYVWENNKIEYLDNLKKSIKLALQDECYKDHSHVILISGNLSNEKLNLQAKIYSEIAREIKYLIQEKSKEGIVAVMSPPEDITLLEVLKESGVEIVVFNLEVGSEPWFSKYCPGKQKLGREYFLKRLYKSVEIFGYGKSWTNFVLGLEPIDELLDLCEELAKKGIVSGANILHLDEGNSLDCTVPSIEEVAYFFKELSNIYRKYNFKPYYCEKALRTSLSNEAYDNRY